MTLRRLGVDVVAFASRNNSFKYLTARCDLDFYPMTLKIQLAHLTFVQNICTVWYICYFVRIRHRFPELSR